MKQINLKVRNLKRVKFFIPECMEYAAVAYGETVGIDLTKAFSGGWYFGLKEGRLLKGRKMGDCIEEKRTFRREYLEFNGVRFVFTDVRDVDELLKVIDGNLADDLLISKGTFRTFGCSCSN